MVMRFVDRIAGLERIRSGLRLLGLSIAAAVMFAAVGAFGAEDDAVESLREKIDRAEKERMEICRILGAIYEEIGDTEKAIESYLMGFQVFPDDPVVCNKLMALYKAKGRWAELVLVYKSLVNANPGANEMYMTELAECHLKAGHRDEAVAVIKEMLDEHGDNADDYRDAAQIFMKHKEYEQAAAICRRGIEKGFVKSCDLHLALGRATGKLEKYGEAVAAYAKAIELCTGGPNERVIGEELASLCEKEGVIERLLEQKSEALEAVRKPMAELYWEGAQRKQKEGKRDEAIALCRRIILLVPDSERAKVAEKKIEELSRPQETEEKPATVPSN
jgi:tetratricopeptide (TPR) repeat protein